MAWAAPVASWTTSAHGLTAIGTAVSVGGAVLGAQRASAAADYQSKLAKQNAEIEKQNAQIAQDNAHRQARFQLREARRLRGAQRAGFAASGVTPDWGSSFVVAEETRQNQYLAVEETLRGGGYGARNAGIRANNFLADSRASQYEGDSYRQAGFLEATGSILDGYARTKRYKSGIQ